MKELTEELDRLEDLTKRSSQDQQAEILLRLIRVVRVLVEERSAIGTAITDITFKLTHDSYWRRP